MSVDALETQPAAARPEPAPKPQTITRMLAPGVMVVDDLLANDVRKRVLEFLRHAYWQFGWKSKGSEDTFSFWHTHFAGHRKARGQKPYECSGELQPFPILHSFWRSLAQAPLYAGHSLIRCYANGQSYGTDGTVHRDSKSEDSYTAVYYPHDHWEPNWAGDTVIFNREQTDIIATIYPRPNRLAVFRGIFPHVARGVSRTCPELRITLMFKTDILDDTDQTEPHSVPGGAAGEPHAA